MNGTSRILTLSYGSFSCTLEGFDDPFPTMKSVVEYFSELAAEGCNLEVEPSRSDAELLSRIVERGICRHVEAKVVKGGVGLRAVAEASDDAVEPDSIAVPDHETPEPASGVAGSALPDWQYVPSLSEQMPLMIEAMGMAIPAPQSEVDAPPPEPTGTVESEEGITLPELPKERDDLAASFPDRQMAKSASGLADAKTASEALEDRDDLAASIAALVATEDERVARQPATRPGAPGMAAADAPDSGSDSATSGILGAVQRIRTRVLKLRGEEIPADSSLVEWSGDKTGDESAVIPPHSRASIEYSEENVLRLMKQADDEMAGPEIQQRVATMQHLKAAVAAALADRRSRHAIEKAPDDCGAGTDEGASADELMPSRVALPPFDADTPVHPVRPSRPQQGGQEETPPSNKTMAALGNGSTGPLVLATGQKAPPVKVAASGDFVRPVRPARPRARGVEEHQKDGG